MRRWLRLFLPFVVFTACRQPMEDGSRLWLRHGRSEQAEIVCVQSSPMLAIAQKELREGWRGGVVRLSICHGDSLSGLGSEGYVLRLDRESKNGVVIEANTEKGILYGAYHLLRLQAIGHSFSTLNVEECPTYDLRILNHWDNLDGSIERGYAGRSLWNWEELPEVLSSRYAEYGRANASIGINGLVLNNVNASPLILSTEYLKKVQALANVFRPYNLRVYLSINFASPMQIGGLSTADPLNQEVKAWWQEKVAEIYAMIPDFGGFLVKANSEGQPGPCDFGRTHSDGANLLADALQPFGGQVMWRAFVYSPDDADRAKQAYLEFQPLDGTFRSNVIVQVKNGPVDFQPREPYSPLFGAMKQTPLMVEFQITQEYLGFSNHVAYLAPMWKEFFEAVPAGSIGAVAGVANIGSDINWCGHHFAQANWYAFGRLSWNPSLSSTAIAEEWLKQTFSSDPQFVEPMSRLLVESREAVVDYMMPLGLHHLFAWGHHYGPEPWCDVVGARPDWMPSYYHRADSLGVGFDRCATGSNAIDQYPEGFSGLYGSAQLCPDEFLLWFHHAPWDHRMKSGRSLWDELCYRYDRGVSTVQEWNSTWQKMKPFVDKQRFDEIDHKMGIQRKDARWWRDACLLYFQQFSRKPFPIDALPFSYTLEQVMNIHLPIENHECPSQSLLDSIR